MNMEEIQNAIEVMQAFVNGEKIQMYNECTGCWDDCDQPSWNWSVFKFRKYKKVHIKDLRKCNAFEIGTKDDKIYVTALTYEYSGAYWKELVKRLVKLNYINVPIYLDVSIRNGNHNNLFTFYVNSDNSTTPLKKVEKDKKWLQKIW